MRLGNLCEQDCSRLSLYLVNIIKLLTFVEAKIKREFAKNKKVLNCKALTIKLV